MGTSTGLERKIQAYLEDTNVSQALKRLRDNALFITMSRMPFRVRNLQLVERSRRSILTANTHLTANPRGSRASSEVPVSPETVLMRTREAQASKIDQSASTRQRTGHRCFEPIL